MSLSLTIRRRHTNACEEKAKLIYFLYGINLECVPRYIMCIMCRKCTKCTKCRSVSLKRLVTFPLQRYQ